jgi:hypothetical protein
VLVTWTDDEPESPIILGLVQSVGPAVGQKLERRPDVARVDGKRVTLSAEDEIELRCGEASITLRRNGRLVIRGAYVETTSRGTNRIRGGSVQVN